MFNKTRLEYEYTDELNIKYYSLMDKLILSHRNYDIVIPRGTITIYKTKHEILYYYLLNQRTVTPLGASWKYLYAMKCNKIPFAKRWGKYLFSLKNVF